MTNIFPIELYAKDMGTWISSPDLAVSLWKRNRDRVWWGADVTIVNPNEVIVRYFDMESGTYGGRGAYEWPRTFTKFTTEERVLIGKAILQAQTEAAELAFDRRQRQARIDMIESIRREMFPEV